MQINYSRIASAIAMAFLLASCKHGVDIKGQGSVTSASGDRDCAKSDAPCRFDVAGAYVETYTSHPASGWVHDSWEVCGDAEGRICKFNVPADVVALFEGESMPSVVARFRRPIQPTFRGTNGKAELPDTPAARQFNWLMNQIGGKSTSVAAIKAHFHADFLAETPAGNVRDILDTLRSSVPNAQPVDLISVTPNFMRVLIGDPSVPSTGGVYNHGDGVCRCRKNYKFQRDNTLLPKWQ